MELYESIAIKKPPDVALLSAMIGDMKKNWERFSESKPGSRFKERYERRQEDERGWTDPRRLFNVIVGTILVVGSAFFGWAPGPGMLTFVIGLAMIGGEFLFAARFLDWSEVHGRRFWKFVTKLWRFSIAGKAVVLACALALISATGYVVYRLFFSG